MSKAKSKALKGGKAARMSDNSVRGHGEKVFEKACAKCGSKKHMTKDCKE